MPHVATQTRKFLRKSWYRIQKDIEELRRLKNISKVDKWKKRQGAQAGTKKNRRRDKTGDKLQALFADQKGEEDYNQAKFVEGGLARRGVPRSLGDSRKRDVGAAHAGRRQEQSGRGGGSHAPLAVFSVKQAR